MLLKVALIVI